MSSSATVTYCDERREIGTDDALSFGRGARDLDLGDNPLIHRRFGRVFWRSGAWWLHNEGSRLTLSIHDRTSASMVKLAAGREVSLSFPESVVRFSAADIEYEIEIDIRDPEMSTLTSSNVQEDVDELTIDQSEVPLSGDQRLLVVALAEAKLKDRHAPFEVPTNKSVAHRFGWTSTQYNRKLDRLCKKFARHGVSGLVGDIATVATNRRVRLVEHVCETGLVTVDDLQLLDDYPE